MLTKRGCSIRMKLRQSEFYCHSVFEDINVMPALNKGSCKLVSCCHWTCTLTALVGWPVKVQVRRSRGQSQEPKYAQSHHFPFPQITSQKSRDRHPKSCHYTTIVWSLLLVWQVLLDKHNGSSRCYKNRCVQRLGFWSCGWKKCSPRLNLYLSSNRWCHSDVERGQKVGENGVSINSIQAVPTCFQINLWLWARIKDSPE